MGPTMADNAEAPGATLGSLGRAALGLALGFHGWSMLVRDAGLSRDEAVALMVGAVLAAERSPPRDRV